MATDVRIDAEELFDNAPPVTEGARAQHAAERAENERIWDHLRDMQGRSFDPSLHQTHPDGAPDLTTRGKLRMKRTPGPSSSSGPRQAMGDPPDPSEYRALARLTVDNLLAVATMVLGPEWAPRVEGTVDERVSLIDAWTRYYQSMGITQLSPGAMVVIAMGGYAAAPSPEGGGIRALTPRTLERIGGVGSALRDVLAGVMGGTDARPDPRPDHVRQEHAGEAPRATVN